MHHGNNMAYQNKASHFFSPSSCLHLLKLRTTIWTELFPPSCGSTQALVSSLLLSDRRGGEEQREREREHGMGIKRKLRFIIPYFDSLISHPSIPTTTTDTTISLTPTNHHLLLFYTGEANWVSLYEKNIHPSTIHHSRRKDNLKCSKFLFTNPYNNMKE